MILERAVAHARGGGDGRDECRDGCDERLHDPALQSFRHFPFHCSFPPFDFLGRLRSKLKQKLYLKFKELT